MGKYAFIQERKIQLIIKKLQKGQRQNETNDLGLLEVKYLASFVYSRNAFFLIETNNMPDHAESTSIFCLLELTQRFKYKERLAIFFWSIL